MHPSVIPLLSTPFRALVVTAGGIRLIGFAFASVCIYRRIESTNIGGRGTRFKLLVDFDISLQATFGLL